MSPTQIRLMSSALLGCAAADASSLAGAVAGSHMFLALCLLPSLLLIQAYLPGQYLQRQVGRRVSPARVAQVLVAAFALSVLWGLAFPAQAPADLPLAIGVLGVTTAFAAAQTWARTDEAKALTLPAVGFLALGIWLAMTAVRLAGSGQARLAAATAMLAVGAALAAMSLLPGKHEDDHRRRSRVGRSLPCLAWSAVAVGCLISALGLLADGPAVFGVALLLSAVGPAFAAAASHPQARSRSAGRWRPARRCVSYLLVIATVGSASTIAGIPMASVWPLGSALLFGIAALLILMLASRLWSVSRMHRERWFYGPAAVVEGTMFLVLGVACLVAGGPTTAAVLVLIGLGMWRVAWHIYRTQLRRAVHGGWNLLTGPVSST